MMFQAIVDLKPFMYVLIISIFGFTDAFYSYNKSLPEENRLDGLQNLKGALIYSLMNTFGEFDVEGFGDVGMVIFFAASLINLVILLNLVIAIICDVFTQFNSIRLESFYQQRVKLIRDCWAAFFCLERRNEEDDNRLLFIATKVTIKEIKRQVQEKQEGVEE